VTVSFAEAALKQKEEILAEATRLIRDGEVQDLQEAYALAKENVLAKRRKARARRS
jgi:hypothetical protein